MHFSDREKSLKHDSSTIQPIGSVNKTFIGLSLMIAKEKGLIDLGEDISTCLDFEFANPYINLIQIWVLNVVQDSAGHFGFNQGDNRRDSSAIARIVNAE